MSKANEINEIYAYFQLSGVNLDPDEITNIVGIQPTQTWKTGDLVPLRGKQTRQRVRKFSVWEVKSKLAASEELDPTKALEIHIEAVFEQLQPGWEQLAQISSEYEALICCVVYAYSHVPVLFFDKQIIQKAGELGASIYVDLYDFLDV